MIEHNTRLLDVLAEEFESAGQIPDVDANGLQEITGLNIQRQDKKGGASQRQVRKRDEDYRGSLSSVKSIKIKPGVELRELV